MESVPSHRERLVPPWWMLAVLLLIVPAALLVFLPVSIEVGIAVAVVLYAGIVLALWLGAPVVELHEGQLRAGRARIGVDDLGTADAVVGDAARAAMRSGWDPADHHVISPWMRSLVRVAVTDEDDPTPAWVISTRRPERLAAAIAAAQTRG
ncbi:DUF3093 domain-containing protein [Agrococcus baldri]|uniref:DUF3093 domain-containing protein n=1 Tax=Agrococcus baldri TaxID=153730 RepID=A0AA87RLY2_9MICO|nr:DUF3093 domain-containing protein [Agrococcus baldri]GEK81428.1 hypothetical protein ABA31_27790 [Agrococcus baldri]